jgi:hypothetical protein
MTRRIRIAALALGLAASPLALHAQGLTPAAAGNFMGAWTLTLDGPQGSFEMSLNVKDEGGKVIGEMSNQMQPEVQKVTDVSKEAGDLVLKFAGNFQGNPFDAKVTLTPDGADKAKVVFDVNGGQFSMSGTGTKAKK